MPLAEDQDLIQAIAPKCANEALRIWVLPGRPRRDWSIPNSHGPHSSSEDHPVGHVIVAHQIGRRCVPGKCLHDLLRQPLRCGMSRHREPQELSVVLAGGFHRNWLGVAPLSRGIEPFHHSALVVCTIQVVPTLPRPAVEAIVALFMNQIARSPLASVQRMSLIPSPL